MRVKMSEVPLKLRRRAANHLESIRGTDMAAGHDQMRLGDQACAIYRPDIDGVAYWEVEVKGVKGPKARDHAGKSSGLGFLMLSTGGHDVPIPHWSLDTEPPSYGLEGKGAGKSIARIVKLDSLAYAAEDAKGNYASHIGQFPPKIEAALGLTAQSPSQTGEFLAQPEFRTENDNNPPKLLLVKNDRSTNGIRASGWKDWHEARKAFPETFKPHLQKLAEYARGHWETEDLIDTFGEGIHEGRSLTVPLLQPGTATISGEGARFVKMTMHDRKAPALTLEAQASGAKNELSFMLEIKYTDGSMETLNYFIVPRGTPSNKRDVTPHLVANLAGGK
ncbi:hypothetical protein [Pseudoduganella violaceinigra]|uniref:hypothetical protein n=1 Tax=Pseudoduganella violaceinigra TaxID=246602 RepID=UPI0004067BF3|nr:hypothetical protein [Pseudoduganella violaceinigra]